MSDVLFPGFPDWQHCYSAYLEVIRDRSGSVASYKAYKCILSQFFSANPGRHPATYTRADVLSFLSQPSRSLRNMGGSLSANSKNCRITAIRGLFRFASEYDLIQANGTLAPLFTGLSPCRGIKYLARDKKPRGMSSEDVEVFLSSIDTTTIAGLRDRTLFTLFVILGKRKMEILRLTWGSIIQGVVVDKDGTKRNAHLFEYRRKSHQREVSQAEFPSACYDMLIRYLTVSGRLEGMRPETPLFIAAKPGSGRRVRSDYEPLTGSSVDMLFHVYLRKCNLSHKNYSLHSLRHASAMARFELGVDIKSIQSTLDHENLFTTSIYLESLVHSGDEGAPLLAKRFAHLIPH